MPSESIAPEGTPAAFGNSPGVEETGSAATNGAPVVVSANAKREANAARARKYRESKKAKDVLGDVKADETIATAAEAVKPKAIKRREPSAEQIVTVKDLLVTALTPLGALEMEGETWGADIVNVACPALAGEPGRKWAEKMAPLLARYMPEKLEGPEAAAAIATLILVGHIGGKVMERREARYDAAQAANRNPAAQAVEASH